MVKAIRITETGNANVMKFVDVELKKLAPNEVLIKNKAIGLNYIDVYHRSGTYPLPLPNGIGLEAAGVIEEIGSDVKEFKVGDRVAHAAAPPGSYSEKQVYPQEKIVKIPDYISDEIASCIMLKGITSEYLLHRAYKVKKDQFILYHAAAGGVGQVLCQWAKSLGCKVIGTVGALQYEVIQYRLEHEYGAKCTYEPLQVHKACWVEATNPKNEEFQEFLRVKQRYLAKDKQGQLVFLADSEFTIQMTLSKYPSVKLHFTSEFK